MKPHVEIEYNKDFYSWTLHNAELIRQKKFAEVDIEHIAEEIESMGRNNRRELINRFSVLLAHLLKWQFQTVKRSKSWALTIKNQRFELSDLLEESPSLRYEIELQLNHAYKRALIIASEQTGIDENEFPPTCPFSLSQCLDSDFLPE
jgi:hypothetical protein